MIEEGAEAPRFRLPGAHEGELGEFALEDYLGDAVVVLAFYRADFGPRTRPGDCWLQDLDLLSLQRNVAVLGIGPDTAYSHRAFADRANVDVPLLADTAGEVAEDYGVLGTFEGHERVPERAVFVVDDRGVVEWTWRADGPADTPTVEAVRGAIDAVKNDESALERYRRAFDYYRYGESEFAIASEAFEDADWHLAVEAFEEASLYLTEASEAADGAHWFAVSDELADELRAAKSRIDHLSRSAEWFAKAGRHYAAGVDREADDYRRDAARQRERADDHDPLPEPDELAVDREPVEAD